MYLNHRNSDSFREEQAKKKAKLDHHTEHSLKQDENKSKYHRRCGVAAKIALKTGNIFRSLNVDSVDKILYYASYKFQQISWYKKRATAVC